MSASRKKKSRPLAVRGVMLDSARLMEKHSYYFDLLGDLAHWGINTLWWHFIDDQGFGVRLDSHPELATDFAFSKAEVRRFVKAAAERGIDVVPEVETLGHAGYLFRLPRYAHLADGDRLHFNAACPSHPDTLTIMTEIIDEIASLFPSKYLHAGLDEVNFSGCARCAERGEGKPDWWIYAEHVKSMHAAITARGKRMIMWADHVEKAPAMLKELPRDIVMAHWQYWSVETAKIKRSLKAGFEVVGAPALNWFGTIGQPRSRDFDVMDAMAETAAKFAGKGMAGMVNTVWVPGRVLRDATRFGIAYTAEIEKAGGPVDRVDFARTFCRDSWKLNSKSAAKALWRGHELALHMNELNAAMLETTNNRFDALQMALADHFDSKRMEPAAKVLETLTAAAAKVQTEQASYNAMVLSAEVTVNCLLNAAAMRTVYRACFSAENLAKRSADPKRIAAELPEAVDALADAATRMKRLVKLVAAEWNRTRYAKDAKKHLADAAESPCGRDMLLGRLARGHLAIRAFAAEFKKAAAACAKTGKVPAWGG